MKKTLILLVCLLLIGSAGVALAGNGSPAPTRDGAVEWVLDWLESLVDQARGALPGSVPVAETHRADTGIGEQSAPSSSESSAPSPLAEGETAYGIGAGSARKSNPVHEIGPTPALQ
jgi:hypothetical protein